MQKGTIGVTTENIFPIIKKFLYSDHEIFLRELVSNAVDATQKLKALAGTGEFKGELGDLTIQIKADPKKGTITISDNGIGMSEEEVQKYINQIALSSAGEFIEKYKEQIDNIIGHFGLGFYSSFMVAKRVEIQTLSWQEGAKAVKWSCDGDPNYTIGAGKRKKRGTDIILYLDDESKEYAENSKIEYLLNKYCKFLPVEISFDGKVINETAPIWTKKPVDLKEEEYLDFYRKLYPMSEEPLFYIHLNVDYPFTLTGILYFPKIKESMDISRNKIQLFSNQVFITDSVENIVPDFLTLLHGVIDSPDIPLNVSRSYLQSDANVKKISSHITKKVADRLEEIFKNEREQLEERWDNLKLFIEYGMLSDEKFYDRAEKFTLFKNSEGRYFSFEEYKKLIEPNQTDKNNKLVYLYSTDLEKEWGYVEKAKSKGYDVLLMDSHLDSHFVNLLESKFKESTFARVDSDTIDRLILKEEGEKVELSTIELEDISTAFKTVMPQKYHYTVEVERLGDDENALLITQSEFTRRYREMSAMGGGINFYGSLPEHFNLVLNWDHPLTAKVVENLNLWENKERESINTQIESLEKELKEFKESQEKEKKEEKEHQPDSASIERENELSNSIEKLKAEREEKVKTFAKENSLIQQLTDLALLSKGMLQGEELNTFIKRSFEMIK
ncbi:MAG: molecular chaperone HtpG [Bacteroidales bacterium]